jgi:hypothetical protein
MSHHGMEVSEWINIHSDELDIDPQLLQVGDPNPDRKLKREQTETDLKSVT